MPKFIFRAEQEKLQQYLRYMRRDSGVTQEELAARLKRPQSLKLIPIQVECYAGFKAYAASDM